MRFCSSCVRLVRDWSEPYIDSQWRRAKLEILLVQEAPGFAKQLNCDTLQLLKFYLPHFSNAGYWYLVISQFAGCSLLINRLCSEYMDKQYAPSRSLRSSHANFITVPSDRLDFGARAFRVAGPTVCTSPSGDFREISTFSAYCSRLRTNYW